MHCHDYYFTRVVDEYHNMPIICIGLIRPYTIAVYKVTSWLPGFARDPPSLPLPPCCPPSLGLPGFGQNICSVIAQNNKI